MFPAAVPAPPSASAVAAAPAAPVRLTVLGTGYLGAVHVACMAGTGHDVLGVGVDVDRQKIEMLAAGRAPFFEPGLEAVLGRALRSGRLLFGSSLASTPPRSPQAHRGCRPTCPRPSW